MMLDTVFARVNEQLDFILPPGMRTLRQDLEKVLKSALQDALSKMDMVTRDEFSQQTLLLEKTRLRITELENRLRTLETRVREMEANRKL
ncbi:MAG: accessory factor UbiK family protein [Pseudomonadales bacterium]|nr:accessory factor UbiK family protein [Pseudomonadales bacterium]